MVARDERREAAAVTDSDHEHAVAIDEVVLFHRIECRLVSVELLREIGGRAFRASTLTDSRLLHTHRRESGLIDEPENERAETVGLAVRVLDGIAAQPADEEDHRHFAADGDRPRDEDTQSIAAAIRHEVAQYCNAVPARPQRMRRS